MSNIMKTKLLEAKIQKENEQEIGSDSLKRILALSGVVSENPASPAYAGKIVETTATVVKRKLNEAQIAPSQSFINLLRSSSEQQLKDACMQFDIDCFDNTKEEMIDILTHTLQPEEQNELAEIISTQSDEDYMNVIDRDYERQSTYNPHQLNDSVYNVEIDELDETTNNQYSDRVQMVIDYGLNLDQDTIRSLDNDPLAIAQYAADCCFDSDLFDDGNELSQEELEQVEQALADALPSELEEMINNDYGHRHTKKTFHRIDAFDHKAFALDADKPDKYKSSRFGSNALANPVKESVQYILSESISKSEVKLFENALTKIKNNSASTMSESEIVAFTNAFIAMLEEPNDKKLRAIFKNFKE